MDTVRELRQSKFGGLLFRASRWKRLRDYCVAAVIRLEGGHYYSATLRGILEHYHGVRVGAYSYGECMLPGAWPAGVTVGRYVSVGPGVRVFLRNHPYDRLSMHPFFYNSRLGFLAEDSIPTGTLEIGHDAWIGERVIITPGCRQVGLGAVIGAGAVVTKDVPAFAVVAGNPARIIRYRFPEKTRELIIASRWWELPVYRLVKYMPEMIWPLGDEPLRHPLLANAVAASREEIDHTPA